MGNALACDGGQEEPDDRVITRNYELVKEGLTNFDIVLLFRLQKGIEAWQTIGPKGPQDCGLPRITQIVDKHVNAGVLFPMEDEDWPEDNILQTLFARFTYTRPIEYVFREWATPEDAMAFLPDRIGTELYPKGREFDGNWPSYGTNDAFTWFNFMAMGAAYIRKIRSTDRKVPDGAVYIADFTEMYVYDVVEPFQRYGAAAYWDENKRLMGIYVSYLRKYVEANETVDADMEWEHAKFVHSCSVVTYTQMITHLSMLHTMVANGLATACYENLNVDHPVRRMLKPVTFRVVVNNYKGSLFLIGEGGAIDRLFAFNHAQFAEFFVKETTKIRFRTVKEMIIDNGMEDEDQLGYPLKDGLKFTEIVTEFVKNYMDIYYEGDWENVLADHELHDFWLNLCKHTGVSPMGKEYEDMVEVIANCIVHSTAIHEMWGTITYAVQHPRQSGGRYREGQYMMDVQNYVQVNLIAVAVTLKQLRMLNDWKHLLRQDDKYQQTAAVFDKYQQDLMDYSREVDALNDQREQNGLIRCNFFDPQYLESGVSV